MTEEKEFKKANEGLTEIFSSGFICPHCKKDVNWCECDDDIDAIECSNCGSQNVEGKIRNTEWGDWEDLYCLNCGNEGSMSL